MSSINSLSGGYKGGSKGLPAPQSTPQKINPISEMLKSVKTYYIENTLADNDIIFIIDNIKSLINNIKYNGGITPSPTSTRIFTFIKSYYKDERLTLDGLNKLIKEFNEIVLNVTQNKKVVEVKKVVKVKNTLDPQTLSNGYKGGSPRIKSEGNLPKIK